MNALWCFEILQGGFFLLKGFVIIAWPLKQLPLPPDIELLSRLVFVGIWQQTLIFWQLDFSKHTEKMNKPPHTKLLFGGGCGRGNPTLKYFVGLTFWKLIGVEVFYVDLHPTGDMLISPSDKRSNNDNALASELHWFFPAVFLPLGGKNRS